MKKIIIIIGLILSCYSLFADGYKLHSSVFGGGATVSNSEYRLSGSVSQPNVGLVEGAGSSMKAGFWNTYLYKAYTSIFYPSIQASNIFFSNISRTGMTVSWTRGAGYGSVLLGKESAKISAAPLVDGTVYNGATSVYSSAPTVGGAKLLYSGTDANPAVSVTGLTKYKLYYFKVCEYNNDASPFYLQTENASNPRSRWTLRRDALVEEDLTIDMEYAYPNPVSNSITTTLDLFEAGTVTAKLYDINGKLAADLYNQALPFGTHELKFDVSSVPSGVYQLIISKGSDAIVYPVSVVR